jgi:hypothetical protein
VKNILIGTALALMATASFADYGTGVAVAGVVNAKDIQYFYVVRAETAEAAAVKALKSCKTFQAKNAKEYPNACKLVLNSDQPGWLAITHSESGGGIGISVSPRFPDAVQASYLQCKELTEGKACSILPHVVEANYLPVYQ